MAVLLFIPGFATDISIFKLQTDEFSKKCQIITSFDEIGKHEELVVIGWSMGGFDAIDLYFEHRDKIKALVLVSSTPRFLKDKEYIYGLSPALLRNLEKKIKADCSAGINYFYKLMTNFKEIHPLVRNLPIPSLKKVLFDIDCLKNKDARDLLSDIRVPVLLIHGETDQICLPSASKYMLDKIPKARLEIFPDCAHMPFIERPGKFNEVLRVFLNEI